MTETQPVLRDSIPLEDYDLVEESGGEKSSVGKKIGLVIAALLVLGLAVGGLVLLLQPGTDTARVRDIFIIFMALEFYCFSPERILPGSGIFLSSSWPWNSC